MVHPDKCPHPQAHQAFVKLNKAFKDLQDPDKVSAAYSVMCYFDYYDLELHFFFLSLSFALSKQSLWSLAILVLPPECSDNIYLTLTFGNTANTGYYSPEVHLVWRPLLCFEWSDNVGNIHVCVCV